ILALNAHLESGHFFNPMAQRISEGLSRGAKMAVVDPRLSNTASHAHYWMPCKPGTEAALVLALAKVVLDEGLVDRAYLERWVNWREFLEFSTNSDGILDFGFWILDWKKKTAQSQTGPDSSIQNPKSKIQNWTIDDFFGALKELYAGFTPEFAERECGIPA